MYVCTYKLHQEVTFLYEYLKETGTATTLTYISLGLSQPRHVNALWIPQITPRQILPNSFPFISHESATRQRRVKITVNDVKETVNK